MTAPKRGQSAVLHLPLDEVQPSPTNPRSDLGDLSDLVDSIRALGVLQPLLGVAEGGVVKLIAGHRRLAASRLAGRQTVPVIVLRDKLPDEQFVMSLAENLHRAAMSPLDEARACQALLDMGRSRRQVATELRRSPSWVADRLALLALPAELQQDLDTGQLPLQQGAELGHQVLQRRAGSVILDRRAPSHFTRAHPLARRASQTCNAAGHPRPGRYGGACGGCWESAIRSDEKANCG